MYYFRGCAFLAAHYASITAPPIYFQHWPISEGVFPLKNTASNSKPCIPIGKTIYYSFLFADYNHVPTYTVCSSTTKACNLTTANLSACPAISSILLLASSSTWVLRFIQLSLTSINHQSSFISILSTSLIFCFSASTWLPRGCVDTSLHQLPVSCNNASSLVNAPTARTDISRTDCSQVATHRPSFICQASPL